MKTAKHWMGWTSNEETALVQAVQSLGESRWQEVRAQLVAQGHPDREERATKQRYTLLKERATAQGGTSLRRLPLSPVPLITLFWQSHSPVQSTLSLGISTKKRIFLPLASSARTDQAGRCTSRGRGTWQLSRVVER